MSDTTPLIELGITPENRPLVLFGRGQEAHDIGTLLQRLPVIATPAHATDLAIAVNHFAHDAEFRVIADPATFQREYREQLAREGADAGFQEGSARLSDYGAPNFADIHPPRLSGDTLVFFAADSYLGVPYRAETHDLRAAPTYTPLPLTPVAAPKIEPFVQRPLSPEEQSRRQTVPR